MCVCVWYNDVCSMCVLETKGLAFRKRMCVRMACYIYIVWTGGAGFEKRSHEDVGTVIRCDWQTKRECFRG